MTEPFNVTHFAPVALESLSAGVYWIAEDARILYVNAAASQLTGYARAELVAMRITDLNVDLNLENWPAIWGLLKANGKRSFEARHRRKDGSIFNVEVEAHFLALDGLEYSCAFIRDLTDRVVLEGRLRQAEKMEAVGRLAGGIAHDFNNQLTGIFGYADLARLAVSDNPKALGLLDQLTRVAKVAADLTAQLLAFSRQGKFLIQPVNLHTLLAEITPILARSISKRITLEQTLSAQRMWTMGDPSQLQSALLNLVLNARDAMPEGGTLALSTSNVDFVASEEQTPPYGLAPGSYVAVHVRDTGVGVKPGLEERIFEPFFTTKDVGFGTGLGLAAVYGTAKNHKGSVGLVSEVGKGSTFTLYLPVARPGAAARGLDGEPSTLRLHGHVLVVDDEHAVRETSQKLLEALGCTVSAVADGKSALQFFEKHHEQVDLVLLDLIMPGMSGRDVFEAMLRIDPTVRVLVASGYSLDGDAQRVIEAGARGFLQKPFTMFTLAAKVGPLLRV